MSSQGAAVGDSAGTMARPRDGGTGRVRGTMYLIEGG
jgi:hypothetical protein